MIIKYTFTNVTRYNIMYIWWYFLSKHLNMNQERINAED